MVHIDQKSVAKEKLEYIRGTKERR